jgi:hypothetical protein
MLQTDRRQSPRFCPKGLRVAICLEPSHELAYMEGEVVDISYTGIKIRLDTPTAANMDGKVRIQVFLPESGIPLTISGILKHQSTPTDLGLHYAENSNVIELDKFMFECIKLSKTN